MDEADDLEITLFHELDYVPADLEIFPESEYSTRCAYREDADDSWSALTSDVEGCIQGPISDKSIKCCSDHLTEFGV